MTRKKFINAKLKGYDELQEILVEDGVFKKIAPSIEVEGGCEIEDLGGKLTLPPYVDPHIHLDYVFTARKQGATNGTGTLFEGIQRWSETKSDLTVDEIKARAIKAVRMEVSHGVQYIRTHADVTDPNLTALKALLELREELKDIVTIQIVSFPQEGMYSYKDGDKLVEEGLKMGADCVGGIPHFEYCREFGEKSIHKVVELAVKYDKLIDVHCDESDDPMSRFVELLTALSIVEGIGPKTTASHTCSLGSVDNSYAFRMMKNFKKAGLNFISCPTENIYLQGRQEMDKLARDIIDEAGYGDAFGHSLGHGVGLEIHEFPNASPATQTKLEAGNVVTVEPGIYLSGEFGVRIEDFVVIRENGCENLTKAPKQLLVL